MIKIFLIKPLNNNPSKIVYADNEDEARGILYADEALSECKQIAVLIINSYSCSSSNKKSDAITIQYKDKTYHLKKNEAVDV